jgi:hypothetical protein
MSTARISITAEDSPLPCLQGRARVGCERSERRKPIHTLKHKQPLPNPPLPSQGRELALRTTPGTHA